MVGDASKRQCSFVSGARKIFFHSSWEEGIPEVPTSEQFSVGTLFPMCRVQKALPGDWGEGRGSSPDQPILTGRCGVWTEENIWHGPISVSLPLLARKYTGRSEGPDRGHRLPGNALRVFIPSFDQTMRTFQMLTQGKKSLFFPGPGTWCQAEARGWEGRGWRPEGGGQRQQWLSCQGRPWTHTLLSFSPPQDLCASGFISKCLFPFGEGQEGD